MKTIGVMFDSAVNTRLYMMQSCIFVHAIMIKTYALH